jgi:hypothetical protein
MTELHLLRLAHEALGTIEGPRLESGGAPPDAETGKIDGSLQEFLGEQLIRLDCGKRLQPAPAKPPQTGYGVLGRASACPVGSSGYGLNWSVCSPEFQYFRAIARRARTLADGRLVPIHIRLIGSFAGIRSSRASMSLMWTLRPKLAGCVSIPWPSDFRMAANTSPTLLYG